MSTNIEWTDETWNPTTGCDQVSPGCDHCYALTMAKRLKAMGVDAYQEDGDPRTSGPGFALQVHEDRLDQPLRWTKPRKVFVNSMSDLFHPKVPDDFIARVWAVMAVTPRHTYQVLTKRPKRMRALLSVPSFVLDVDRAIGDVVDITTGRLPVSDLDRAVLAVSDASEARVSLPPLPNVWLGTSVEDQQRADERIPALLDTPAAVRFLSCEPLLGPVDLRGAVCTCPRDHEYGHRLECVAAWYGTVDWIIVGGESGPGARPMHPQWARDLRDQATAAGVPFLFKQWGAWSPDEGSKAEPDAMVLDDGRVQIAGDECYLPDALGAVPMANVGKHAAGRELDGRTWDEFPQEVTADA